MKKNSFISSHNRGILFEQKRNGRSHETSKDQKIQNKHPERPMTKQGEDEINA